jgi:hypothetical protein
VLLLCAQMREHLLLPQQHPTIKSGPMSISLFSSPLLYLNTAALAGGWIEESSDCTTTDV